jgi:hypothetical protein
MKTDIKNSKTKRTNDESSFGQHERLVRCFVGLTIDEDIWYRTILKTKLDDLENGDWERFNKMTMKILKALETQNT